MAYTVTFNEWTKRFESYKSPLQLLIFLNSLRFTRPILLFLSSCQSIKFSGSQPSFKEKNQYFFGLQRKWRRWQLSRRVELRFSSIVSLLAGKFPPDDGGWKIGRTLSTVIGECPSFHMEGNVWDNFFELLIYLIYFSIFMATKCYWNNQILY